LRGFLFADLTALFAANHVRRDKASVPVQPAAQKFHAPQRRRFAGEIRKNGLGDVLGKTEIPSNAADSDGIDEVDVLSTN